MKNSNIVISVTPEIAIDKSNNYAGGLGTLEADKFYEMSKFKDIEYYVFSILYRNGYVKYEFDMNGNPQPMPQPQEKEFLEKLKEEEKIIIKIGDENIEVIPKIYSYGYAKAILFDINDRKWEFLNDRVYIENSVEERFYKYIFLAKATKEYITKNIDLESINYIDLQEAYTAILPLILNLDKYRFVIHTPGRWGHPEFSKFLFKKEFDFDFFNDPVVLTDIGNAMANKIFCVSKKHFEIIKKMFPHFSKKIDYVTNGVNLDRWVEKEIKESFEENEMNIDKFTTIKERLRKRLYDFVLGFKKHFDIKDEFIVAWSRRMVEYKRPDFILRFIKRNKDLNIIYVIAGKAHPHDSFGLKMMKEFYKISQENKRVVFIPEYNIDIARTIIQGVDLLLFTPLVGHEASGTSFMKAGANGTLTLCSHDGSVPEIVENDKNSWIFGDDKNSSYELFENKLKEIYRIFAEKRDYYNALCVNAISSFIPKVDIRNSLKKYYPEIH